MSNVKLPFSINRAPALAAWLLPAYDPQEAEANLAMLEVYGRPKKGGDVQRWAIDELAILLGEKAVAEQRC